MINLFSGVEVMLEIILESSVTKNGSVGLAANITTISTTRNAAAGRLEKYFLAKIELG